MRGSAGLYSSSVSVNVRFFPDRDTVTFTVSPARFDERTEDSSAAPVTDVPSIPVITSAA